MQDTPKLPLVGSCLCGDMRLTVTMPPMLTFACHCRDCQKLCASAYSLSAMIPSDGFSLDGPEPVRGGLGDTIRHHYCCARCKTFLFTRIGGVDARVNVRATLFDDTSWLVPFLEVMTDEKLPWVHVPTTHSFARHPTSQDEMRRLIADYAAQ